MKSYSLIRSFARVMLPEMPKAKAPEIVYGVVSSVQTDGTCTVFLGGTTEEAVAGMRRLRTTIVPGDVVVILKNGPNYTVIGSLSDQKEGLYLPWVPQINQGATTDIAKTTTYGKYFQTGQRVEVQARMTLTAVGTGGSPITIEDLPLAGVSTAGVVGVAEVVNGGSIYKALVIWLNATQWQLYPANTTTANGLGSAPSFALAIGDLISIHASYEAS